MSGQGIPHPPEPPVRIGIRTSPRDGGDLLMVACLVAIGVGIVVWPIAVWHNNTPDLLVAMIILLGVAVAMLIGYAVVNVTAVVVDGQGIRLHRWHGWDRVLAWDRITAIRQVTRGEALYAAFCTPWRSTHWGLSMRDVFCIQWGQRRFYFPPTDPAGFRQAVRRWRPELLPLNAPLGNAPPSEETGNPYQPPRV